MLLADAGARALGLLAPEAAHRASVRLLKAGLSPAPRIAADARLAMRVAGLAFPNPLGLAAGFDKHAEAPDAALALGFGFVEVGGVTPRPQPGNPRPRVFRLRSARAVINRYGLNSEGLDAVKARLAARRAQGGIVGINLGANKDAADRAADYATGVSALAGLVDYFTVNVSSPNTPGLRALQGKAELLSLLAGVLKARADAGGAPAPVFVKVAPDLTDEDKADITAAALDAGIDGLVISNTTVARDGVAGGPHADEAGGLSGAPLLGPSTEVLRDFQRVLKGRLPLIGVGGVSSARDVYRKVLAGASLVQLYTALVYEGPGLPARILSELPRFLDVDGASSLAEVVGAEA